MPNIINIIENARYILEVKKLTPTAISTVPIILTIAKNIDCGNDIREHFKSSNSTVSLCIYFA